jgi:prepilin-type N-terminal cleavage/methylation domain-containing protein
MKKGFTLIELMVVILIVAILAAVAIPILRGRLEAAKWSEGKATMGSIATAIRAYHAEKGPTGTAPTILGTGNTGLGFNTAAGGDLDGTYFTSGCYAFNVTAMNPLAFTVTCTAATSTRAEKPTTPATSTLTGAATGGQTFDW